MFVFKHKFHPFKKKNLKFKNEKQTFQNSEMKTEVFTKFRNENNIFAKKKKKKVLNLPGAKQQKAKLETRHRLVGYIHPNDMFLFDQSYHFSPLNLSHIAIPAPTTSTLALA